MPRMRFDAEDMKTAMMCFASRRHPMAQCATPAWGRERYEVGASLWFQCEWCGSYCRDVIDWEGNRIGSRRYYKSDLYKRVLKVTMAELRVQMVTLQNRLDRDARRDERATKAKKAAAAEKRAAAKAEKEAENVTVLRPRKRSAATT